MRTLTNTQKITYSLKIEDAFGNPAKVDGVPEWSSSDPSILTVTPAADGLTAVAETVGPLGNVQVRVSADADLGAGVRPITAVDEVSVEASEAVTLGISAGAPEPRI